MVKKFSKTVVLFFLILIIILSCSACKSGSRQNITFYPELVQYKLWRSKNSTNEFSFNIEVVSSNRNIDIEYISAEGINTENLSVTFSDDTFEELNGQINGKYLLLIGVHCFAVSDYTKIDSMKLKIDGEDFDISFPISIENTFFNDDNDDEHCLSPVAMPTYIFTTSFVGENETDYSFVVTATDEITVTEIKFDDFIEFSNATVIVNDVEIGKINDVLPLKLDKEDTLKIFGRIKTKTDDGLYMGNIYTNLMFNYKSNSQQELTEYYPITAAYIGSKDEAKKFLDSKKLLTFLQNPTLYI